MRKVIALGDGLSADQNVEFSRFKISNRFFPQQFIACCVKISSPYACKGKQLLQDSYDLLSSNSFFKKFLAATFSAGRGLQMLIAAIVAAQGVVCVKG